MNQFDGVSGNHSLVTIINDLHGKEVMVELKDGNRFVGIFAACSNELSIGLKYAYEKKASNEMNLLPIKKEINEKMLFEYGDVVVISALITDEKKNKGFATDRDYHSKANGKHDEQEFEEWEDEESKDADGVPTLDQRNTNHKNGWSVKDMFDANSKLGVQSSYVDNLSQYTTAEVKGSDKDRARAEQIAAEIENSASSKYYSRLENDDEERDLDKLTAEDELDTSARRGRGSYSNVSRGRGGNVNNNRRSDGMKGGNDRRSSGANSRYGSYGQQQRPGQQHYIPGQNKRPTGQEVQDQFQEWKESAARKEGGGGGGSGGGKIFENSTFKAQPKVILENASRGNGERNNQSSVQWRRNVTIHSSKVEQKADNDHSQNNTAHPSEGHSRTSVPAGNAWNKGPPMGLVNCQQVPSDPQPNGDGVAASTSKEPEESRDVSVEEPTVTEEKEIPEKKDAEPKEEKDAGSKKFTFNVNAPAFTPRVQTQPPAQPTQVVQVPQQQIPAMTAIPVGTVSAGMPMQAIPPPGVFSPMAGRSVAPQFQGAPQGFSLVQSSYPQYLVQPPVVGSMAIAPQRGATTAPPTQVAFAPAPQGNQRRSTGPATAGAVMMQPGGQWQNQMIMQQVPYGYQQYALPSGATAPPQTYVDGTQMIPQGQQQIAPQQYQQRYGPPIGYVYPQQGVPQPGQPKYAGGQPMHDGNNPPHTPAISSTGPNSQPPTPGPQPAQSPAQAQVQTAGGRGSPANVGTAPPPVSAQPQQPYVVSGSQPPMVSHQPIYHTGANMVVYPAHAHPQVIMYNGSMPVPHMQPYGEHHHMEGGMIQPGATQQMMIHDQYGNYVPPGNPLYYQAPPHPGQQQAMSRQNSVPQAVNATSP
ncbi:unnamed protein product [Auanema sp. JU1783]|nr:unnamed protein product [Auanema sp. JU1783]